MSKDSKDSKGSECSTPKERGRRGRRGRHARSEAAFPRQGPNRKRRKRILIVCEGTQTEPRYFTWLCRHWRLKVTTDVEVVGEKCGNAPISVVECAVDRKKKAKRQDERAGFDRKEAGFAHVWCVFDVEEKGKNESIHRARNKAKDNEVECALSNPSFELWFLYHYEETSRPFKNAKEVIKALKKHVGDYDKASFATDRREDLIENLEKAMKRSKRVLKEAEKHSEDPLLECSATNVHELVELLKNPADSSS